MDPKADRAQSQDDEYVNRLLAEIADLKRMLVAKDDVIAQLCDTIKTMGSPSTISEVSPEIPLRSNARRLVSHSTENRRSEDDGDLLLPTLEDNAELKPLTLSNSVALYKSRIRLPYTLQNRSGDEWRRLSGDGTLASKVDLTDDEPRQMLRQVLQALVAEEDEGDQTPKQLPAPPLDFSPISDGPPLFQEPVAPLSPLLKLPAMSNFNNIGLNDSNGGRNTPTVPTTPEAFRRRQDSEQDGLLIHSPVSQVPPATTSANTSANLGDIIRTPTLSTFKSQGSFHVLSLPQPEDDLSQLFIKPDDFHSIYLQVLLTFTIGKPHSLPSQKKREEINFTVGVTDRDLNKQMWKIRKLYAQLLGFDLEIRPFVDCFGFPNPPDRLLFLLTLPAKVDQRRQMLEDYFNSLFNFPHIPQMVLFKICKFLLLDFVNPLDDYKSGARREGFLLRRYKGLGSTWRVRWCQVENKTMELHEYPGGPIIETIKLQGAQIGRQNLDAVADDKGYRHAFLIMEAKTNTRMSNLPKHFFCAETDQERDEWVEILLENNDAGDGAPMSPPLDSGPAEEEQPQRQQHRVESASYSDRGHLAYLTNLVPQVAEEEPVVQKRKKKSLFPFSRYRNSSGQDELPQPPQTPVTGSYPPQLPYATSFTSSHSSPRTTDGATNSMQQYIEHLSLEEGNTIHRVFGRELTEVYGLNHRQIYGREVPAIVVRCIDYLQKVGAVYEEGIFRLSGLALSIRQLKDQFDVQFDVNFNECNPRPDMHTVALLLKTYLRELPNPILGAGCFSDLNSYILRHPGIPPLQLAVVFRDYFNDRNRVSAVHYNTSYVIFKFLTLVIGHANHNRMNLRNVCIVFVPTLNLTLEVLQTFLIDFECIFERGVPVPDLQREVLEVNIPTF